MRTILFGGVSVALGFVAACSSDEAGVRGAADAGSDGAGGAGARANGTGSAGGRAGAGGARSSGGSAGTAVGCARFAFVASGVDCRSTGCSSFSCDCPDAFPISIAKCTPDGCLVGGDCAAICAAHVDGALGCADTYTVASQGTGGSGAGGSGAGGSTADAAPPPQCTAADVKVHAESAVELGSVGLQDPKMVADTTGALYVTAQVARGSAVDVGGGPLPAGTSLIFFKLDANKKHAWSRRFGGTFDTVSSLSFANNGDLLIGGWTSAQTDLGGGPEPVSATPQLFVARYDRDGNYVRGYLSPAPSDLPTPPSAIETPTGDILFFETFTGTWQIGGKTLTSAGESDIAILRFAAAGTITDVKQFGHARNDLVFDAVGASDGSVYVLGFSYYTVDFGANPIDLGTDSASFVVRLDSTLSPVWQKLLGRGGAYPRHAYLDGSTLVVAGDASGSLFYGDPAGANLPAGHVFVFRIDTANGNLVRADTYAPTGSGARVTALGPTPGGGTTVGGYIRPPTDFGSGPLTTPFPDQPFLAEFDGAGKLVYSTLFCSSRLAGGVTGAIGNVARDVDSTVFVAPFGNDFEVGSARFNAPFGSVLVDMPPAP